jgi:hypothetical protein
MKTPSQVVDEVFDLYKKYSDADYIGEPVSQIEYTLQSAQFAIDGGYDDEVIRDEYFDAQMGRAGEGNQHPDHRPGCSARKSVVNCQENVKSCRPDICMVYRMWITL